MAVSRSKRRPNIVGMRRTRRRTRLFSEAAAAPPGIRLLDVVVSICLGMARLMFQLQKLVWSQHPTLKGY